MMKVIISDSTFSSDKPEREILQRRGCSLVRYQCETEDQLIEAGRGAHAALVQYANITRRVLESWTDCGIIVRYGIGTDNIDLRAAEEFGITVCNVPTYCLDEVADHTAALLLSGLRKVLPLHEAVRRGVWDVERIAKPLPAFTDTVVGLVGFGKIAVRVAERLVPFHLQLRMYDPYADPKAAERLGVRPAVTLEELLREADAISLHVPLTPETRYLLNRRTIAWMKPNAFVVNTSRGALIDAGALAEALKERRLGGAALDVLEREPLEPNHPLANCDRILFTPHAAYYSERSLERLQQQAAQEIVRWLEGNPLSSPVNTGNIAKRGGR